MCILFEPAIPLPVIILKEITMDGEEFTSKMFLTIFLGGIANNSDKKKNNNCEYTTIEFGSNKPYLAKDCNDLLRFVF